VESASLLQGLESFLLGLRCLRPKPRLDEAVLRKDMREIGNQVLDDPHVRQRIDGRRRRQVGDEPRASQPVRAIDVHRAGTADALAARAAKGERRVHLVLDPEQSVQDHRSAVVEVDLEGIEARVVLQIRIEAIDFEGFYSGSAAWGRPFPTLHDARPWRNAQVPGYWKPLEQRSARHLIRGSNDHRSPRPGHIYNNAPGVDAWQPLTKASRPGNEELARRDEPSRLPRGPSADAVCRLAVERYRLPFREQGRAADRALALATRSPHSPAQ